MCVFERKLEGILEELKRGDSSGNDVNTVPMYEILKNKNLKLKTFYAI